MGIYKRADISPIQMKIKNRRGDPDGQGDPDDQGDPDGQGDPDDQGDPDKQGDLDGQGDSDDQGDYDDRGDSDDQGGSWIEDKLANRKDINSEEMRQEEANEKSQTKPKPVKTGNEKDLKIDKTVYKPKFSWKDLVRQFVATQAPPQTTYTRPSSRAATQMDIARQTGVAAIKPGERPGEDIFKLLMVFDTSGSMSQVIGPALAEARALLTASMKTNTVSALGVCFFADKHWFFAADLQQNKGWSIPSFKDLTKPVPPTSKKPLNNILSFRATGGTDFNSGFAAELSSMAAKGYNIILFSDSGIIYDGDNWTNLVNLYKSHKQKFFFIADNSQTYNEIVKKLGVQPNTFGHL